jgi:hypothetical protein
MTLLKEKEKDVVSFGGPIEKFELLTGDLELIFEISNYKWEVQRLNKISYPVII